MSRFKSEPLRQLGVRTIKYIVDSLVTEYAEMPTAAVRQLMHVETKKPLISADEAAEVSFKREVRKFSKKIEVFGEESLPNEDIDLTNRSGTFALVDALDGSDLYERGFGNWCSAAVFFTPSNPEGKRIRAAVVGLPDGTIYHSSDDIETVWVTRVVTSEKGKAKAVKKEAVGGCSVVDNAGDASICFYGQKIQNFRNVANITIWQKIASSREKSAQSNSPKLGMRIYNLAGIPMLVRMADHRCKNGRGIDLVIEIVGQQAHDAVPGLYLAKKAGAIVMDLDGTEFTYTRLEQALMKPKQRISYVAASTKQLAEEAIQLLRA